MSNLVSATIRYGAILGVMLALSAGLFEPANAGQEEPERARFAAVLLPPAPEATRSDDDGPLIYALQRNGYRDPLESNALGAARITASVSSLRGVMNKALDATHREVELLLYYRGLVGITDGTLWIGNPGSGLNLEFLAEKLAQKAESLPIEVSTALLLDVESENSLQELERAATDAYRQFQPTLHVIIGRCAPAAVPCPSRMIRELRQLLTYDHQADGDGDTVVSMAELSVVLATRLRGAMDVAYVAPPTANTSMPIAWLGPPNLDAAIEDLSHEIAQAVRDSGATATVITDFAERGQAASSGRLGPLVPYIGHQVRRRIATFLEQDSIPVVPAEDRESAAGMAAVAAGTIQVDFAAQPVLLTMSGTVILCKDTQPLRTVPLRDIKAFLCTEEAGMSGHLNMSPKAAMSAGIEWSVDDLDMSCAIAPHPMADPGFPLRVYLVSENGTRLNHHFSEDGRRMYVDVAEGDQYAIAIENHTDQDVFLRLLVDGRNTLPDRLADGDPYEPAQYVSLTRARSWFCEANTNYRINGFYTRADADGSTTATTGRWQAFRVTDIAHVSPGGDNREQLGIITAAFYQAVAKAVSPMAGQPEFATCPGTAGSGRLNLYNGDLGAGLLIGEAPINIHYGFRNMGAD